MSVFARPIETSFTPGYAGVVRVTVNYNLWTAFSTGTAAVVCEQSSVSSYGPFEGPVRRVDQHFTASYDFVVTAGSLVKVGLAANAPGTHWMVFTNLVVRAEFIPS